MNALPTRTERPAWQSLLWPLAWLALQAHLLVLGLMSVGWNLAALLLYPLLPRSLGLRVGRAMIAFGYGLFWRLAAFTGMMRLEAGVLDAWWPDPACRPTRGIAGDGYDGQAQVGSLTLGDPAVGNVCYLTAEAGIEHPTFMYSDPALTAMARAGTARLPGWVTSAPLTLGVAVFEFH